MVTKNPSPPPVLPVTRERLTIDVSPDLLLCLDDIASATGMSRNAAALMVIGDGIVAFLDKARELKSRAKGQGARK